MVSEGSKFPSVRVPCKNSKNSGVPSKGSEGSKMQSCWGLHGLIPQQLEKRGVLPIKLRGGLGQPPKTLHQVPPGSARFHKGPHKASILTSSGSARFHIEVPFLKVKVPQGST